MALTFIFLCTTSVCHGENFPAPNPPTDTKTVNTESRLSPRTEITLKLRIPENEWVYHKTVDNQHPNGMEQQQLWLVNRARTNPSAEGEWLASETHSDVADGRDYFGVDIVKLKDEFAAINPMPPAAFDRRLYEAAKVHSEDLISRDAQDHNNQFQRVTDAGFSYTSIGGVVFSYSETGLQTHAAFNIDWGNEDDGMQTGRGHRVNMMSVDKEFFNVGIASIAESDDATNVGPFVTTGNYAKANNEADHYNDFIVGTVWRDQNSNGRYDPGEGYGGVRVEPNLGSYYAITSNSGGYAIPITEEGDVTITFSGGTLPRSYERQATLADTSILIDLIPTITPSQHTGTFPWTSFLPAIIGQRHHNAPPDCNGTPGGSAYQDQCNTCVAGTTGLTPCRRDCNNVINGTAVLDACGVCGGNGSTCGGTFERDASSYLVTDTQTGLMWQDSRLAFKNTAEALQYCQDFSLEGYDDWRLPTLNELQLFFKRVDANDNFDLNYWGTFSGCTAAIANGGYVKTPVGVERYGGEVGDTIAFTGGAAARCVRQ